ncbi:MAG: DNA repair protein RecN [Chloroflexi bacterium]|nr:DNA repair protein RecN [Chloroflexota bacterium]
MLTELRVSNFGIIEEIDWSPGPGLNVITGETGAGKSLIIDAVEALLAGTAGDDVIRHGAAEAHLEGIFTLPKKDESFSQIRELLIKNGLEAEEETLVVYCEFRRQGRDVLRVNRHAVTKGLLHQIGRSLLDIYGQTQHMSLLNSQYQLDFLDSYAGTIDLRRDFSAKAVELAQVEQELKTVMEEEKDTARREEFLRFQIDEISRAELQEGEEEELEHQRTVIASAEKLKASSYEAYQAIYGADKYPQSVSALEKLNEALLAMKKLVEVDPTLKSELDYMEETVQGLAEVARDIRSYSDRLEYDPRRLEAVESRLELINSLKRKYGQTIAEILTCLEQAEGQLEDIAHSTERRAHLEEKRGNLTTEMGGMASALSEARIRAAEELVIKVKGELQDLNMSQVEFQVSITQRQAEERLLLADGKCYSFTKDGVDQVEFMASTNPGEPLKPLARIASTGEISRFMLALKGALSEADDIPVLVFDEIDIGIGGRSGEIIGEKLWTLAQNRQVICVTHLPQIAAFADAQYAIHKETVGDRTLSIIESLDGEPRVREIAVMLSGLENSEAYLDNARELIRESEEWKATRRSGK